MHTYTVYDNGTIICQILISDRYYVKLTVWVIVLSCMLNSFTYRAVLPISFYAVNKFIFQLRVIGQKIYLVRLIHMYWIVKLVHAFPDPCKHTPKYKCTSNLSGNYVITNSVIIIISIKGK